MQFQLSPEDADTLRQLASLEPMEARRYLQDHPEFARRVTSFPPEIRIEVCRMIFRSFDEDKQDRVRARRHPGSDLVDLLDES